MSGSDEESYIVRLRGLPFSASVDDVLKFLSNVNVLNGEAGVHLTEVAPGRPSGECYVELESEEDVEEALKRDKENMGKRYIEVFKSDKQDMELAMDPMRNNSNGHDEFSNSKLGVVRIRGLPFGCSKEEIVQFFGGLRVAPDGVRFLLDATGRASGEAFVHFVDKATAQRALLKFREKIGHRYIEVFTSSLAEVHLNQGRLEGGRVGAMRNYYGNRMGMGRGYNRPEPYDRNDRFGGGGRGAGRFGGRGNMRSSGFDNNWGGPSGGDFEERNGGHFVHMRGLPFKATQKDIAFFFKPLRPIGINILFNNRGRPSGEADVEFECHEDAVDAMSRDQKNMDHRYIELFLDSTPDRFDFNRSFADLY